MYLVDTCVLSELRKRERAAPSVRRWFDEAPEDALWLSAVVLAELRRGVELKRRRDPRAGEALDTWLHGLTAQFAGRILAIDALVADAYGRLGIPDPLPVADGLIAATALVHDLVVVTRNTPDFARAGVRLLDPWRS